MCYKILGYIQNIVEKITGKECIKCKHCINGLFCDNFERYYDCMSSIYPYGFEPQDKQKRMKETKL